MQDNINLEEFKKLFEEAWCEKQGVEEYRFPLMSKADFELFNKTFKEAFLKDTYGDKWDMTYEDLRSRVLSGYTYSTTPNYSSKKKEERKVKLYPGQGGALLLIDTFEKDGLPAIVAAEAILCHTDQGTYSLSRLTVKRIKTKI